MRDKAFEKGDLVEIYAGFPDPILGVIIDNNAVSIYDAWNPGSSSSCLRVMVEGRVEYVRLRDIKKRK